MKLVEIAFSTGARRRPEGWLGRAVAVYAAGTALWVVYAATYALIDALALTIIFLTLIRVGEAMGAAGVIPPVAAAWFPNVIFFVAGLGLMARVKT